MELIDSSKVAIPDGFIVFISGCPGVGKTTISYELLKRFDEFRIIEETDLIREVLRGFNDYFFDTENKTNTKTFNSVKIHSSTRALDFSELRMQCEYMKPSLENIVKRQKRRGIASIINGVHIIPDILDGISGDENIIFINLYMSDCSIMQERLSMRDGRSFSLDYMPCLIDKNIQLFKVTSRLSQDCSDTFHNIDVSYSSVEEIIAAIILCLKMKIKE